MDELRYEVVYLDSALDDLAEIKTYLGQYSLSAWGNLLAGFEKVTASLTDFPYMGEKYKRFRRLVYDEYLIFYKVRKKEKKVEVMRFLHCRLDIRKLI